MKAYTMMDEDLTKFANQIKECVLAHLANIKLLTEEETNEFLSTHAVVVSTPGFFGKLWCKFRGEDPKKDSPIIYIAKIDKQE